MNDECLLCGKPLEYLDESVEMECAICHKKELSNTRCVDGHFVCNECHTDGMDVIWGICKNSTSKNPIEIMDQMMGEAFCHMHGPEHHIMVGAALLTAFKNAGGDINLNKSLKEMRTRGKQVPGGTCGFWGACGAGISAGIFMSIVTGSSPLAKKTWGMANKMTSKALESIGEVGGPRCCKRDSYISILDAIQFANENLGVNMESSDIVCKWSKHNNQCIGLRCPFFDRNHINN